MNTTGKLFRVTTWGESHGKAMGCVIDGCPAGLTINEDDIAEELAHDIPLREIGTGRSEPNDFDILSGVFNGKTIGTPISIVIYNKDTDSKPYEKTKDYYRPGHADLMYRLKYGNVDHRGGSRASGRECISRITAGYFAKLIISEFDQNIKIKACVSELAGIKIFDETSFRTAVEKVKQLGQKGDSTGGKVKLRISGMPSGLGEPVFGKLSAMLFYAMGTIGGVKAVEIGEGTLVSYLKGSQNNDFYDINDEGKIFQMTNRCGGILGGISTGSDIELTLSVKPTPTISVPQLSVSKTLKRQEEIIYTGRHDINFTPRVCPVSEAMAAILLSDFLMIAGKINRNSVCKNKAFRSGHFV
jgi:chorismate synthase